MTGRVGGATEASRGPAATGPLGQTWWAQGWLEALQERAQLDPNRLPRGRAYARGGNVDGMVIAPGEVRAGVGGRERKPYQVRIRVRTFDDGQWAQVLDTIAARAAHTAAMLAGELPAEVAARLADAGLSLLPGAGEIGPRCTCPDEADPCKHAAAVCYLVADELDRDPFLLLLLRGRTRDEVLAGLRSRRRDPDIVATSGDGPATPHPGSDPGSHPNSGPGPHPSSDPGSHPGLGPGPRGPDRDEPDPQPADPGDDGLDARAVFARLPGTTGPMPVVPLPPERPGRPAPLPLDLPVELGHLRADLLALAGDAAERAWELATGASDDGGMGLDPDVDLARRAAAVLGTAGFSQLSVRCGVAERELVRQALAWRHGGRGGLDTLWMRWDPATEGEPGTAQLLQAALAAVRQRTGAAANLRRDRLTVGGLQLQLRFGRDLRWYPYRRIGSHWEPAGRPNVDPVSALAPLLGTDPSSLSTSAPLDLASVTHPDGG